MRESPNSRINTDRRERHFVPLARAGYAGRTRTSSDEAPTLTP